MVFKQSYKIPSGLSLDYHNYVQNRTKKEIGLDIVDRLSLHNSKIVISLEIVKNLKDNELEYTYSLNEIELDKYLYQNIKDIDAILLTKISIKKLLKIFCYKFVLWRVNFKKEENE